LDQTKDSFPVANIEMLMLVPRDRPPQSVEGPGCIAFWPEKYGALVVVDAYHQVTGMKEMEANLRPD
jgi:hypothetical protein